MTVDADGDERWPTAPDDLEDGLPSERSIEATPGADAVVDHLVVANAFRDLSANQREVLELTLLGEFTHSEAATHLGIPLGTVKTRHRRGLKALRASLSGAVA